MTLSFPVYWSLPIFALILWLIGGALILPSMKEGDEHPDWKDAKMIYKIGTVIGSSCYVVVGIFIIGFIFSLINEMFNFTDNYFLNEFWSQKNRIYLYR